MLSQAHHPVISRLGSLEKIDGVRTGRLPLHAGFPEDRNLRLNLPIAASGGFGAQQHSRGSSETINRRVQAISRECSRFAHGSRDANSNRKRSGLPGKPNKREASRRRRRNRPNAERSARRAGEPEVSGQWPVVGGQWSVKVLIGTVFIVGVGYFPLPFGSGIPVDKTGAVSAGAIPLVNSVDSY